MFENFRLINFLTVLSAIVLVSLFLNYFKAFKKVKIISLTIAIFGIFIGTTFLLNAVLPNNNFYGPIVSHGSSNEKIIALTFDDGPYSPYTEQILDVLKEKNVKATFFIVGHNAASNPEIVKRIVSEGHQIGNHTYNHIDLLKTSNKEMIEELSSTNKILFEITGQEVKIMRPPFGAKDANVVKTAQEKGLQVITWSVDGKDWLNRGVDITSNEILTKATSGDIILLHDGDEVKSENSREQTVIVTKIIVDELIKQGYELTTVDKLLEKRISN
ncbi:polysaccharide deacetylase family protein [Selenomonadales bacterium OttesenSCG-928-I06]|nr:polysaccharide deacetylase family protein [Selenomonadales bacterium OttesenSCG-928-I06]